MGCAAAKPATSSGSISQQKKGGSKSRSERTPSANGDLDSRRCKSLSDKGKRGEPGGDQTMTGQVHAELCAPGSAFPLGPLYPGSELGGIPEAPPGREEEGSSAGTSSPETEQEGRGLSSSKGSSKGGGSSRGSGGGSRGKGGRGGELSKSSSKGRCSVESLMDGAGDLRVFSYDEMRHATAGFSVKLGEGGFGVVYRGRVEGHEGEAPEEVAVKVLRLDGGQGLKEWTAEVVFLGSMRHKNLVRLLGLCYDCSERMLVYEYIPNHSFDKHLFPRRGAPVLSFPERMKVALGAAQGLAYLHKGEKSPVIFRDLKTSNILVDQEFNAKLSDFGMAREGPDGSRSHISTDVVGTSGYLAPEYITRGHVSERCDVFSFGVVLLEVITGRNAESEPEVEDESMVQWAARVAGESRDGWHQLVDPRLEGRWSAHSVKSVLKAAFMCIQHDPKARPSMENVIETLKVAYARSVETT